MGGRELLKFNDAAKGNRDECTTKEASINSVKFHMLVDYLPFS